MAQREMEDYNRQDYEYGEYNFPEDGYDYSKHLRSGGGGFYTPAPAPELGKKADGFALKEELEKADAKGNASDAVPMHLFEPVLFQSANQMTKSVGVGRNVPEAHAMDLALDPLIDPEILAALDGAGDMESGGDLLDDFIVTAQTVGEDDWDDENKMEVIMDPNPNSNPKPNPKPDPKSNPKPDPNPNPNPNSNPNPNPNPKYLNLNPKALTEKDVAYTDCFGKEFIPNWAGDDEQEYDESGSEDYEDDSDPDERKTVRTGFTGMSMTSSRRERGEQGRNLDEMFDDFLENYEDGGLEEEDCMIGQELDGNKALEAAMDEFIEDHSQYVDLQASVKKLSLSEQQLKQVEIDNLKPNQDPDQYVFDKPQAEWDVETIVSTYSNLENHPKLLDDDLRRIKLSKKTGLALGVLPEKKTKKQLQALEEEEEEEEWDEEGVVNLGTKRDKKETPAEKKARKQAIKEEKANRRADKKGLRTEYKQEEDRQRSIKAKNPRYGVSVKHLD